jgi:hypothetical protein
VLVVVLVEALVEGHAVLTKIASTTKWPASCSPRALRRKNAMPSGTAVSASPTLWMRSASSATLPVAT